MNDDTPSGQTQIVQNQDPWSGQQPYLSRGFERAQSFLDQPLQFYPNSTVVPFAPQTEQALQLAEQRATAGSPLMGTANQMLSNTLGGSFLSQGNPYLQNAFNAAAYPITQAYENAVLPGINSTFSAGGRYGSNAHQNAMRQANEGLARTLGDLGGTMAFQNYGQERQRQLQAGTLAPTFAGQDYTDIGQLANVGATREAQASNLLGEDISRYMFAQQAPRDALSQYMALVAGGRFGGTSTQTQPLYSNPFLTGLGALGMGTGIMGSLFGQGGVWPGALRF